MHPSSCAVQILATNGIEGQALAPGRGLGPLIDTLDEGGEDAGVSVSRAGGKQDGVGVPRDTGDGRPNGLLDVLGDPPVVLLLEVAHGDQAGARAHGKLCFRGSPAHTRGSTVDAEKY